MQAKMCMNVTSVITNLMSLPTAESVGFLGENIGSINYYVIAV